MVERSSPPSQGRKVISTMSLPKGHHLQVMVERSSSPSHGRKVIDHHQVMVERSSSTSHGPKCHHHQIMVERSSSPSHGRKVIITKSWYCWSHHKTSDFGLAFSGVLLNSELLYSLNLDAFKGALHSFILAVLLHKLEFLFFEW